jgi:hypothetical protein
MKNGRKLLLILALAAAVWSRGGLSPASQAAPPTPAQGAGAVRFVALGDAGQINPAKLDLARVMDERCAAAGGCQFAIYLGDNIYPAGAKGAYHQGFEDTFETPFRRLRLPFYVTQGNHDNSSQDFVGGDGHDNTRGDAEVEYHYRRDRATDRWRMPARYYSIRYGDVEVFCMDTNAVLEGGVGTNDLGSAKQLAWLRDGLSASTARWKIVFGHHPYVSNGAHGNAGSYRSTVEPQGDGSLLKTFIEGTLCDRADFYFNGHDHHLEWLKAVPACGRTEFIISGAASEPRALTAPNINEFYFQRGGVLGFWLVEVTGDTLRAVAYDVTGALLFDRTVTKTAAP